MRRLLAVLATCAALTGAVLVLPVVGPSRPAPVPVETTTDVLLMGSVTDPAGDAEVRQGPTAPMADVPADQLVLRLTREHVAGFSLVGVTWTPDPAVTDTVVQVRARDTAGVWSGWTEVGVEDGQTPGAGSGDGRRGGTAPLWTGPSTGVEAELVTRSGAQPTDVALELIDPGSSPADVAVDEPELGDTAHAATAMPPIHSRAQWGADEAIMGWTPQYATTIKASTVHHTDTANTYTADQVPGIIRSIYSYHAQSLGWGDIGYNVLVDRFGRAWEGRYGGLARPVVGAHAGGFNTGTFGVAMLGSHTTARPSQTTLDAVAAAVAWKFSLHGVDPRGSATLTSGGGGTARYARGVKVTVPTVFGHRDTNYTTCPGDAGYARMPEIRDLVAFRLGSAHSSISARYEADAALRDSLGVPIGAEQSVDGVSWQEYRSGARLYSSASGGVRVVRGSILSTYLAAGGPAVLGAPISDDARTPEGAGFFVDFQRGSIFWSPATETQVVRGSILSIWRARGGTAGPLGFPTTSDAWTSDGRGAFVRFQGGDVYWSPPTGTQVVRGGILDTWLETGGAPGPLGFPTTSDAATADGRGFFVRFQGGDVYWSPPTGVQVVRGGILDTWLKAGGSAGSLGFPTTSDAWTSDGRGAFVRFQGGDVYWSPPTGVQVVRGGILDTWLKAGGSSGSLGFPTTSDARTADGRGFFVRFQGGDVYWSPPTGVQVVRGGILDTWLRTGGSAGPLGFPTTSDAWTSDGRGAFVRFQGGDVYWSPPTGVQVVRGGILDTWLRTGGSSGPLGFPTTSDARTADGRGFFVRFQGGDVYWSPPTGVQAVTGPLANAYVQQGGPASTLGFPTRSTYAISGGERTDFERGALTFTTATGAVTVLP
ncbi:N-acetylmuramoyl-L-alanine amidase [Blastococcus montanus]|uniref:N-acetylmuramoyl-L-alanine amidase n=1 Tax=Blastococcus montanus TaxID=3144973 RepID=UPI003208C5ED